MQIEVFSSLFLVFMTNTVTGFINTIYPELGVTGVLLTLTEMVLIECGTYNDLPRIASQDKESGTPNSKSKSSNKELN